MSYASRLVAMSRGHVPNARSIGGDAEPSREEVAETDVHAAPPGAFPVAAPGTNEPVVAPSAVVPAPQRTPARSPVTGAPSQVPREASSAPVPARDTNDVHTIVEAAPPAASRLAVSPVPPPAHSASVMLPAQARWLAEDTAEADPLVASAETDALRHLMRSVRQWTASAPTVIERDDTASSAAEPRSAIGAPDPAPTQVSIGNVTITVEDAPATTTGRTTPAARSTSDRLARNHIRGG